jgi:hypothetical protein
MFAAPRGLCVSTRCNVLRAACCVPRGLCAFTRCNVLRAAYERGVHERGCIFLSVADREKLMPCINVCRTCGVCVCVASVCARACVLMSVARVVELEFRRVATARSIRIGCC